LKEKRATYKKPKTRLMREEEAEEVNEAGESLALVPKWYGATGITSRR
jgi:hypothetical protein